MTGVAPRVGDAWRSGNCHPGITDFSRQILVTGENYSRNPAPPDRRGGRPGDSPLTARDYGPDGQRRSSCPLGSTETGTAEPTIPSAVRKRRVGAGRSATHDPVAPMRRLDVRHRGGQAAIGDNSPCGYSVAASCSRTVSTPVRDAARPALAVGQAPRLAEEASGATLDPGAARGQRASNPWECAHGHVHRHQRGGWPFRQGRLEWSAGKALAPLRARGLIADSVRALPAGPHQVREASWYGTTLAAIRRQMRRRR